MKVEFIDGTIEIKDWELAAAEIAGVLVIAGPLAFKCLLLWIERFFL